MLTYNLEKKKKKTDALAKYNIFLFCKISLNKSEQRKKVISSS